MNSEVLLWKKNTSFPFGANFACVTVQPLKFVKAIFLCLGNQNAFLSSPLVTNYKMHEADIQINLKLRSNTRKFDVFVELFLHVYGQLET